MNKKSFLIVVAHPDDAELMFGGIISSLKQLHHIVNIVVCSNGDKCFLSNAKENDIVGVREKEQCAAARFLCVDNVVFLEYKDGNLVESTLKDSLAEIIIKFNPDYIFTHSDKEFHSDHKVVVNSLKELCNTIDQPLLKDANLRGLKFRNLIFSADITELYDSNTYIYAIDYEHFKNKIKAIALYKTQFNKKDITYKVVSLGKFLGSLINREYGEAIKFNKSQKIQRFEGFNEKY